MRKLCLLALFGAFMCFSLVSCEKNGDVLKGTWKNVPAYNSSSSGGAEELDMTYKFDGKGKFTYKAVDKAEGYVWNTAKGTYTIEEHKTKVRLQGVHTNVEGIENDFDFEMRLNLDTKPATLSVDLTDDDGRSYGVLVFEKQ